MAALIPPMLAQLQSVDANVLKDLLIVLLAAVSVYTAFRRPNTSRTIEPQPFLVEIQKQFLPREEARHFVTAEKCEVLHEESERRLSLLEHQLESIRSEAKHDRAEMSGHILSEVGKLHSRINDLLAAVSAIGAKIKDIA
jgi:hypothetical protein